jgi:predicted nucleotidyltransferase
MKTKVALEENGVDVDIIKIKIRQIIEKDVWGEVAHEKGHTSCGSFTD